MEGPLTEEQTKHMEALKKRAESYRRDPEMSRHLNSRMVPVIIQRIAAGKDSIEAVRHRVKAISENRSSIGGEGWMNN